VAIQSVRDLLVSRWGVPLNSVLATPAVVAFPSRSVLFKQDAARVGFIVVNFTGFTLFIAPAPANIQLGGTGGIRLEANGGTATAQWDEDGEMVAYEWVANAVGGGGPVFTVELRIDQGRGAP